jgi:hypothetical protein
VGAVAGARGAVFAGTSGAAAPFPVFVACTPAMYDQLSYW